MGLDWQAGLSHDWDSSRQKMKKPLTHADEICPPAPSTDELNSEPADKEEMWYHKKAVKAGLE